MDVLPCSLLGELNAADGVEETITVQECCE